MPSNVCMFVLKRQFVYVFLLFVIVLLPSFHCGTDSISVLKSAYEEHEQKKKGRKKRKWKTLFAFSQFSRPRPLAWLSCVKCGKIIDYAQLCFKCKWNKLGIRGAQFPN